MAKAIMTHLDLFSGIGGFAYAADQVFGNVEHIFCDNDKFCQAVLRKHWPESEIYESIESITNTNLKRCLEGKPKVESAKEGVKTQSGLTLRVDIVTGGFPCQPFSHAGLRRGTDDKRFLWPEMLRVIRLVTAKWIIAENVGGLLTWNDGLVFEQVCADMEAEGYEVQPFVIPAAAVNAPHRRDRVWFVAHSNRKRRLEGRDEIKPAKRNKAQPGPTQCSGVATNARQFNGGKGSGSDIRCQEQAAKQTDGERFSWESDWQEVAAQFCRVDDGLPRGLDRANQLKAYGNAIVPQVAMEIMEAIKESEGKV